jgi:hypothetical protein
VFLFFLRGARPDLGPRAGRTVAAEWRAFDQNAKHGPLVRKTGPSGVCERGRYGNWNGPRRLLLKIAI